ncbi:hypothetical protein LU290_03290 [Moraxella nasibovis]|uniref:hypothetical protein n=1 Tax=Moraxella nasibovis TaxID=2904120 RepID=UPI00240EBFE9|nr:hypothetical protein [Moraxella nasibovis]WFF39260.1 hypothetical protein LU290_03290 [Moraxella nasibovis]
MKHALFAKLTKAANFDAVYELVQNNCTIADEYNPAADYLKHLRVQYIKQAMAGTTADALATAKQRACQMMGGTDRQQMMMFA